MTSVSPVSFIRHAQHDDTSLSRSAGILGNACSTCASDGHAPASRRENLDQLRFERAELERINDRIGCGVDQSEGDAGDLGPTAIANQAEACQVVHQHVCVPTQEKYGGDDQHHFGDSFPGAPHCRKRGRGSGVGEPQEIRHARGQDDNGA